MVTSLVSEYNKAAREDAMAHRYTRRQYLTYLLIMDGVEPRRAEEMVREVATLHPELSMDEEMTWAEWMDLAAHPHIAAVADIDPAAR